MTTIHDPLTLICGDSWEFDGSLCDTLGAPLNLNGAAITWKLDSLDGTVNYITLSIGNGIAIQNLAKADIFVRAIPAQTAAVPPGVYDEFGQLQGGVYRDWLRVTLGDGSVLTEWSGLIKAVPPPA